MAQTPLHELTELVLCIKFNLKNCSIDNEEMIGLWKSIRPILVTLSIVNNKSISLLGLNYLFKSSWRGLK
jgi:hypothetical protein